MVFWSVLTLTALASNQHNMDGSLVSYRFNIITVLMMF